jgi:hypothetical protein
VTPISRTIGKDWVVVELIVSFTHDTQWDYLLPGIPPTGKARGASARGSGEIRERKSRARAHLVGPGFAARIDWWSADFDVCLSQSVSILCFTSGAQFQRSLIEISLPLERLGC